MDNNLDAAVDKEVFQYINPEALKSFFLFAGAGSGKTATLVNILKLFKETYGEKFRLARQRIAVITYTNAACNEINHRLENAPIFQVSTIHSFAWELIKFYREDIREWLRVNLTSEIATLQDEQSRSKNLQNKTSIDRAKKIESKTKRLANLDSIVKFNYTPKGDNITRDSLNHSQVISIAAAFIDSKPLMQEIVIRTFPILLIDESQDTKKELIEAFFKLQNLKTKEFCIGLFGDTMQRIYSDGKENLGRQLPEDWAKPVKRMNHRSCKRIITLINSIRAVVDNQQQVARGDKEEGFVRLFIADRTKDKAAIEDVVTRRMSEITNDSDWSEGHNAVKILILEHHMAANRMDFLGFFEPLYKQDRLSTGLLEGSLSSVNFFTKLILPLLTAYKDGDKFEIARIVKKESKYLSKTAILASEDQLQNIAQSKAAVDSIMALWENNQNPALIAILNSVKKSALFPIPETFYPIVQRTEDEKKIIDAVPDDEEDETKDDLINAWDLALSVPFSQLKNYNDYISENSRFGTHQGVKGLEYDRVMVILDDEEAKGFMFQYDKLFGVKELSDTDKKNIKEGKETGIDRTRRLFYVACSRAKRSLAVVAYTDDPKAVEATALQNKWFAKNEIEILS